MWRQVTPVDLGEIEGSPEGIAATEAVWVAMGDAGTVVPIDPGQ